MTSNHAESSLVRLAATTPARDWARLRLTGRLDWRRAVAEFDLCLQLTSLVARVVRRSRLWRSEKVDLARELSAHFSDGLNAGRTPEQLASDFGDPAKAARLMRRAKKRNRHWAYHAFIRTAQGLGAILIAGAVLYAILAWRFFSGEPTITRNFAAEYNREIEKIPEADRAWDLYIQSYALTEPLPESLAKSWPAVAPEHPRYPDALQYLERQAPVIELVHAAAARPHLGAPISDALDPRIVEATERRTGVSGATGTAPSENPTLISILLPELAHFRAMARMLAFDAHVAAGAGEADRASRDITTLLGMANHTAERPWLISGLVAIAIDGLAIRTTAKIVHQHPSLFTSDQLRDLVHRHAAFMDGNPRVDLAGERWFFEDVVQRVYTDDGEGNGRITAAGVRELMKLQAFGDPQTVGDLPLAFGPVTAAVVADRASMTRMYESLMSRLERDARLPLWEHAGFQEVEDAVAALEENPVDRIRYSPILILMPAVSKAAQTAEIAIQHRDALLTGIALELYQREHAAFPDSLDALVPEFLPSPPRDRFTGALLGYDPGNGSPRLWSVGADHNDDAGRPPATETSEIWKWRTPEQARRDEAQDPRRVDGDWLLWPIEYNPVTADEEPEAPAPE